MRMPASKDRHDVKKLQWRRSAGRFLCWKISLFLLLPQRARAISNPRQPRPRDGGPPLQRASESMRPRRTATVRLLADLEPPERRHDGALIGHGAKPRRVDSVASSL